MKNFFKGFLIAIAVMLSLMVIMSGAHILMEFVVSITGALAETLSIGIVVGLMLLFAISFGIAYKKNKDNE